MFKMWGDTYIIQVPKLWDRRPDDLRWTWCNNIRNEVHNECNALESSWKYPLIPVHGKMVPRDQFHGRLGTTLWGESFHNVYVSQIIRLYNFKYIKIWLVSSVQFSSVAQSCPTLCDPMNRSTPGLPAHHQLPEFTQTHVHLVSDAIQPSHPLLSPSPPAPNPSQHQSLFQWVNSSHEVPKVLEFQL